MFIKYVSINILKIWCPSLNIILLSPFHLFNIYKVCVYLYVFIHIISITYWFHNNLPWTWHPKTIQIYYLTVYSCKEVVVHLGTLLKVPKDCSQSTGRSLILSVERSSTWTNYHGLQALFVILVTKRQVSKVFGPQSWINKTWWHVGLSICHILLK